MKSHTKTIEINLERVIPASVDDVFNAWLDPKVPGTLWNYAKELIFDPKVGGLFYVLVLSDERRIAHYGRFTQIDRPGRIQHTFVSPNTRGLESVVTVTFRKKGEGTLMVLRHEGLPDDDGGRGHEDGWSFFLGRLEEHLAGARAQRTG
ncbi:MAG TPA: SRPBCC domain-containing protein [Spirochaetia bacterium]|nr:SRPBCC domain-containing protein [Spirochaetia bacterium]